MLHEKNNLSKTEIDEFLTTQKIGTLSLTDGERPYGVPLAYSYDGQDIYLSILAQGRKFELLNKNNNVSFNVMWMPGANEASQYRWRSVICEGTLDHLIDPDDIEKAVRIAERNMNLPQGAWDHLLAKATKNPEKSMFWKLSISNIGARAQ
jgi:nitroimidazol reductase NimA-like FMN-containing flavoprotein (pyridoxamine 5'-phosphate oxidase superfamily)